MTRRPCLSCHSKRPAQVRATPPGRDNCHRTGSTPPAGRDLGRDAVLERPCRTGPVGDFRAIRLCQIAEDHTIGNVVGSAGLLVLVLERHLDDRPDCAADTGLRDPQAGHRYLLCPDRLSPVAEDRPHFYVRTLSAASADAPAGWPCLPGRVSVSRLTLYRWARALHARPSRLPAPARRRGRARADQRGCTGAATGRGNVRRCVPARYYRTVWRTIAVTICPGKSGHK